MIKRDSYLKKLIAKQGNGMIKVITGIRRCGKSYLLLNIFKNYLLDKGVPQSHIIEVALDQQSSEKLHNPNRLDKYLKSKIKDDKPYYILLDEIQEVKGFEYVLNGLLRMENVDTYVTGSNSKFLSSDVITEFRGRGDEIRIHPLSYKEFHDYLGRSKKNTYEEYSLYGGLPALIDMSSHEEKATYLNNIFDNVYFNDVIDRNSLKSEKLLLGELLDILSSNIGRLTNPSKLADTFNSLTHSHISRLTISNYLDCFIDAFLLSKAQRFDIRGKRYIDSPFKYYFEDIGLRNVRLNFRQEEPGYIMESIIYNELVRRGYSIDVGTITLNYKDKNDKSQRKQLEIDFIANKGNKRYYIQSAYLISNKEKLRQESQGFLKIDDTFKKIIIQKDLYLPYYDENGIYHLGVEEFLLDEEALDR